ncbi:MAG: XamI family restriction endonuclease [Opitutae bacterium]|nr:XamI family restriction endonuclease [Opitutae bacterium]
MWPDLAPKWTAAQVARDAAIARDEFRQRRLGEPLQKYLEAFARLEKANRQIVGGLARLLAAPVNQPALAEIMGDKDLLTALRYVGAPPVSEDDLETLSGESLTAKRILADAEFAGAVRDVLCAILDPKRFPWIAAHRPPTKQERNAAILASTVLASSQEVQTKRRSDERQVVEGLVHGVLVGLGYRKRTAPQRGIQSLLGADVPKPGEFMTGCTLGENNADFVLGLWDSRLLVIEAKGSNSAINSRKRLNMEAVQKAKAWAAFGRDVVSAAAIRGVFNPAEVLRAQETPLVVFWAHRIDDLKKFVATTKKPRTRKR